MMIIKNGLEVPHEAPEEINLSAEIHGRGSGPTLEEGQNQEKQ